MNDIRWQIVDALCKNSKPMRSYHIAKALNKPQNQIDYHLRSLLDDGLVICREVDGKKLYATQAYLRSSKVENDLKEVFLASIPASMDYFDFSHCQDKTLAYMNNVSMLMMKMRGKIESEIENIKKS